ncbi:ABC transporter permease [Sphingomonas jatrophae]|uniref:Peptide/nickel transport system permease protein n=1 Tax=Sphingomonas jatrophae TaxID=1166337 RepID=A0A1I6KAW1_9SPHN|nr:ABC transporter permease [Sphingomonas jatrophae]SFR88284.1 peptide/nickel transport system permease protein [Sphingomonas jatrophae]
MSARLLLGRLAAAVPLLLGISLILFAVVHLAPGGPLDVYADNPSVTPAALERLAEAYGLKEPLPVQYAMWLKATVAGDWGYSIRTGRPVLTEVAERLGPTLMLAGAAAALAFVLAVALGTLAAARAGRWVDRVIDALTLGGLSLPSFWLALVLQYAFAVRLGWLPSAGMETIGASSFGDRLAHLALPATVLAIVNAASWTRYIRAGMIDVLSRDYIRTAYAKGMSERTVLLRHGLRNAIVPAISVIALDLAGLVSGAVITEAVFAWPGIGSLFVQSMDGRDYPVLMGVLLMGSAAVVLANIMADLVQAVLDPRLRDG